MGEPESTDAESVPPHSDAGAPAADVVPEPGDPPKPLGVKRALLTFVVFVGVQLVAALVLGIMGAIWMTVSEPDADVDAITTRVEGWSMPLGLVGAALAALVVWRMARRSFPGEPRSVALAPLGWTACRPAQAGVAALLGFGCGVLWIGVVLAGWVELPDDVGLSEELIFSGPWQLASWALLAAVIAPLTEEFVFRGMMLTGLRARWGGVAASATVTSLFVVSHVPQVLEPAIAGVITVLGTLLLVTRLRTGSLLPCVVLHAAYNSVLVVMGVLGYFAEQG